MNEELKVVITAEIGDLQNNVASASEAVNDFATEANAANSQSSNAFSGISASAMAQFAIIESAVGSAISKIQDFISDAVSYGDTVDKQSQMMQMSAQSFQEWSYVLQRNGTDISALKKGIKGITGDLGDMAQGVEVDTSAYDTLGVSLKNTDGSIRSTEDVMKDCILSLAGMEDTTTRNALAQDLFGNSYAELLPLLNSGADSINELIGVADKYAVVSDEDIKASADLADAQLTMNSALQTASSTIAGLFMPAISAIGNALASVANWVKENKTLAEVLVVVIAALAAGFAAYHAVMKTVDTVTKLVTTAQAILNGTMAANPIAIVIIAITALIAIIVLLVNHWDEVKEVVVKVWGTMKATVEKAVEAIKGFIEKLVTAIKEKFEAIKAAIQEKLEAASQIISNIFNAIKTSISEKIEAAKTLVQNIFDAIKMIISEKVNAAKDTVSNVFSAIYSFVSDKINAVKSNVSNVFNTIRDTIENVLNVVKSTVSNIFGAIYNTISEKINKAKDTVKSVIDKIKSIFNFSWKLPELKLPHVNITGKFSLSPLEVPHFSLSWYAKGGVFDMPTFFALGNNGIGGLGEDGAEAIVPLEKNTEWLTKIADMLNERMGGKSIVLTVNDRVLAETTISSINNLTRQTGNLGLILA